MAARTGKKETEGHMVLVFVVYGNAIDDEMTEMLKTRVAGYTRFEGVRGEGSSEPRLGSHVWPGINNCVMTAVDDRERGLLMEGIGELKRKFPHAGVKVFAVPLLTEV